MSPHRKDPVTPVTPLTPAPNELLEAIAREHLHVETLETRHWDRLDFHEVAVWGIRSALQAAYEAGCQATQSAGKAANAAAERPNRAKRAKADARASAAAAAAL
jgi:hypothetical protein